MTLCSSPDLPLALGIVAGLLTTSSFFPQVWRTWRTRSAEDLSYGMLLLFLAGLLLWLLYGLILDSLPIVLANTVTIGLVLLLILMKRRFGGKENRGIYR